jgi:hypothetical protein
MDAPDISVYGEAKGEYTRQLCVFLTPCLESYFLALLDEAKMQTNPTSQKYLWNFQTLLQAIPDWNQDKVLRETEVIQKDCKCDYLEELLTAVFIAHTKVLSAIRLTTKQKKLQITIPKIDHFLHRVLSDCARSLWANAFLFVDTNSIEKQKNLRQVSALVHESILQAIRGLLPVKSILREYLHDDGDDDGEEAEAKPEVKAEAKASEELKADAKAMEEEKLPEEEVKLPEEEVKANANAHAKAMEEEKALEEAKAPEEEAKVPEKAVEEPTLTLPVEPPAAANQSSAATQPSAANQSSGPKDQPMIYIDTKPSVSFAQEHVMFDSDSLEANEIHDLPFAEAEMREDEEDEGEEEEETDSEKIQLTDEVLVMDADETLA